ncbi:hypothetical protein E4U40_007738 [Claviceps sp. LM458 group G5]|nr:hypothetical protein E4U40_007738 [Claviceps sp. LM458 group G5]
MTDKIYDVSGSRSRFQMVKLILASTGTTDSSVSQTLLKQAVTAADIGLLDPGREDSKVQKVISEVKPAVVISVSLLTRRDWNGSMATDRLAIKLVT